jgi:hypothetical protein
MWSLHMRVDQAFPGRYVTKDEIRAMTAGQRVGRIERVVQERLREDDPASALTLVYLAGWGKGVKACKSNFVALAKWFNEPDSDDWGGRDVEVYIDEMVSGPHGVEGGIRMRPAAPVGNIPPASASGGQRLMNWAELVQFAGSAGIGEEEVKAELKARGCTKLNAEAGRVIAQLVAGRRAQAAGTAEPADDIPF